MCREAVYTILCRASSEPWFLREMLRNPEETFPRYDLTLDEKKALLSGSIAEIEAHAGIAISPWLKERLDEAFCDSRCHDAYLAGEEKKRGKNTPQSFAGLTADEAVKLVEEFLRKKDQ